MFWLLIFLITGIIIWKLFGSPSDMAMIISIGSLIISSEMFLWRNLFRVEKNVAIGFTKVKYDLNLMENKLLSKLDNLEDKMVRMENDINVIKGDRL